jgi:hypothetical protein
MPEPLRQETEPDPFAPAALGPVTLRNRIIKAATYENMARGGLVTDALIDFHVAYAAGGVGMTTVAYCAAACADGQARGFLLASRGSRRYLGWYPHGLQAGQRGAALPVEESMTQAQVLRAAQAGSRRARRAFAATSRPSITDRHKAGSWPCSARNASARASSSGEAAV